MPPLQEEKYLSARLMRYLPIIFGERGEMAIGVYQYFRKVDDLVDEGDISREEKLGYLDREIGQIKNWQENEWEETSVWKRLRCSGLPKKKEIYFQAFLELNAIRDDVVGGGRAKSDREARHYNWRTLLPCLEGLALILNGRGIRPTAKFMKLLDSWNSIGSLIDLEEDAGRGMYQLPLQRTEIEEFNRLNDEERDKFYRGVIGRRFGDIVKGVFEGLVLNQGSFLKLDLPLWQRYLSFGYMIRADMKTLRLRGKGSRGVDSKNYQV